MTSLFPIRHLLIAIAAVAGGAGIDLAAQAPPRPGAEVKQIADLWHEVWPADFNGDGRADLVAGEPTLSTTDSGRLVVRLNLGNATFGPPIASGVIGAPATTGDFNRDGRQDVVTIGNDGSMSILPGRGDGTFGSPRALDPVPGLSFALGADFNADGIRDLVLGYGTTLEMNTGFGDFTFAQAPMPAGNDPSPVAGISGDFNGDGRRDLAVAQRSGRVFVYLNRGGMLFDVSEIVIADDDLHGITAGDLDGDGALDLIVTRTRFQGSAGAWTEGGVEVLKGNGNGTFAAPATYHSGIDGPFTAVVGRFNGDGMLDVAVGNQSFEVFDDERGHQYWDSVSVFPGRGDGTLAPAATFRLDTSTGNSPYRESHHGLRTNDIDADGRTDIITSPGAIVLSRASAANRPPVVNAGPDMTMGSTGRLLIAPTIAEPDWDWLRVEWRHLESGELLATTPSVEFFGTEPGTYTLTVTVTDQRGGTATDSMVVIIPAQPQEPVIDFDSPTDHQFLEQAQAHTIRWTIRDTPPLREIDIRFSDSLDGPFRNVPGCINLPGSARTCEWFPPGPVGPGWLQLVATTTDGTAITAQSQKFFITSDAGGPTLLPEEWHCAGFGALGDCTYFQGDDWGPDFVVEGAGADIWGTEDEFFGAYTYMDGDFSFTTRVASVENINRWTKAGIMIRDPLESLRGGRHASLFVTPTTEKGVAFQRRPATNGPSIHTAGPVTTAPVWLKLVRSGDVIRAFTRKTFTSPWALVGEQRFTGLPRQLQALFVVSSHVPGTMAKARFDHFDVDATETLQSIDIGTTTAGRTGTDGATTTIEGNGADIWNTADQFRFHYARLSGNGSITARVRSLENTHAWAKAGVMIRETLAPGSKHAMAIVSAGKGIAYQYRATTGGASASNTPTAGTAPQWMRIERLGTHIVGYTSDDGEVFEPIWSVHIAMPAAVYVGLAVTSHSSGSLATAVFDDVSIRPF